VQRLDAAVARSQQGAGEQRRADTVTLPRRLDAECRLGLACQRRAERTQLSGAAQHAIDEVTMHRRTKREDLEWRRRRQHGGEHQAPERMFFKRSVQLLKSLRRYPLSKQFFSAFISDGINHQTSER